MKKTFLTSLLFVLTFVASGQERIFSIGWGKTFVNADSSSIVFTVDLNRIPGLPESQGGFYIWTAGVGSDNSNDMGFYLKPSLDVNLGTGVTSAPNNISVGLPFGFTSRINKGGSILAFNAELIPEYISDRDFTNQLRFVTLYPYLRYGILTRKGFDLYTTLGVNGSVGDREVVKIGSSSYKKITVPLNLVLKTWRQKGGTADEFSRINLSVSLKYNNVSKDDLGNGKKDYWFLTSKFDFFFTRKIGFNVTYNSGYAEPVFKKNHSLNFGLSFAR